jgi:hypothetical protein
MFAISEAAARATFEQRGELSAAIELRAVYLLKMIPIPGKPNVGPPSEAGP